MRQVFVSNSEAESQEHIRAGTGVPQVYTPSARTNLTTQEAEQALILPTLPPPTDKAACQQTLSLLAADRSSHWETQL